MPEIGIEVLSDSVTIDPATSRATVAIEALGKASHLVRITPQREGLTDITVRLTAGAQGTAAVYSIPVLVAPPGG
jgi:hypothetical protein